MHTSIGEILKSAPLPEGQRRSTMRQHRRTGEKVRRHSKCVGIEGLHYKPVSRRETRQIVLAAKKYDRLCRDAGNRNGPLGHVALEVLEYLCNVVCYRTGELQPAYSTLCAKLNRSRDAIARALKALRLHGFLDWVRRTVRTGAESGPQLKQINNAYRLFLPAIARRLLGREGKAAPLPDDVVQAAHDHAAQLETMAASLTPAEQVAFYFDPDDEIGQILARMAPMIERESAKHGVTMAL
jgi:hypothetical protein